ncbi:MAG: hypothetical protein U5R06_24600 [candidate division KSB1 bacterium]|nr:hypothetical protein [candidate division KSB1 bacterium]
MRFLFFLSVLIAAAVNAADLSFPLVDTGQSICYDESREITAPGAGDPFYGQDAQMNGNQPNCRDNDIWPSD